MAKMTAEKVGHGYDALTELLDQIWGENLHHGYWTDEADDASLGEATTRLTDKLMGMLTIATGDRLLDIGCGVGEPAIRLATAHAIDVVGISISQRQVERAHERAVAAGVADRVAFQFADAMDLPFPEESFDLVWALESLHHMPDRSQVLRQAAKVLRPGGRMAIGDFVLLPTGAGAEADAARVQEASKGALRVIGMDQYLSDIRAAGLVPAETVDVSAHTRPSWGKGADAFEAAREPVEQLIGAEQLDLTISRMRQLSEVPTAGYALMIARKPA